MSKRICLQSGHLNIKNNCDLSLRGSTGAGGEVQINEAVRNATAEILEESGIQVKKVDANFNCDSTSADEQNNEPEYRTVAFIKLNSLTFGGAFLLNML